ncbi:MAG TPA: aminoglycoside phosphotransferase family protein, partial [Pyrinomonadaceae bacterium]|nr:aminoglycoside phosphotransferase family protein [Pyrinomonadaceae bacterium]
YTHVAASLQTQHDAQIPRPIAYFEKHHLLLLEPAGGLSLSAVATTKHERAFFRLGRALKTLHCIEAPSSTPRSTRLTPDALTHGTTIISQARPDIADLVHNLSAALIKQYQPGIAVFLHGDVHPKNILLNEERLFLLDLDQAATGLPEVDLGSVIAGLYCDACTGLRTWREASALKRNLLDGYGAPQSSHTLRWHVAAALLNERALRSVTRVRVGSLERLPEILLAAKSVLNGGISEN